MSSITKVALAGVSENIQQLLTAHPARNPCETLPHRLTPKSKQATGNLGPAILNHLLNAGFQVTVLTRKSSTHSFPSSVRAIPVDYDSLDSLTNALKGQDAVVSTLGAAALDKQQVLLVEAAAKAGVKRFIPSEFGADTLNDKVAALPVFRNKLAVHDALKKEAVSGGMTYTIICTGPFLDWGIAVGLVMNLKEKSISLVDGGDRVFSTTTLPTIGKAVAGVLKHPEDTKDRAVFVQDTALTLKELATMGKKATGPEGWKETVVPVDGLLEQAWAEMKKEQPDPNVFVYNFIKAAIWGEGYGSHFERLDNELLGFKEMDDAGLQSLVDHLAK